MRQKEALESVGGGKERKEEMELSGRKIMRRSERIGKGGERLGEKKQKRKTGELGEEKRAEERGEKRRGERRGEKRVKDR